jgi:hypothetical protein
MLDTITGYSNTLSVSILKPTLVQNFHTRDTFKSCKRSVSKVKSRNE